MSDENGRGPRTPISAPFGITVERRYVCTCDTCATPSEDGPPVPRVVCDTVERGEAINEGKAHAQAHRDAATEAAKRPLPIGGLPATVDESEPAAPPAGVGG